MKLSDLSSFQKEILTLLLTFSEPIHVEIIYALVPLSPSETQKLIRQFTHLGWVNQTNNNVTILTQNIPDPILRLISNTNRLESLNEMIEQLKNLNLCDRFSPNLMIKLLNDSGRNKEEMLFIYECAVKDIKENDYREAVNKLITALTLADLYNLFNEEECSKIFITASLNLSDLFPLVRVQHDDVIKFLLQAQEISIRLGDKRSLAIINLHLGRIYHIINKPNDAFESLTAGLKMVKYLGDKDILDKAAEFFGLHYYIRGMFKEAANYFEQAMSENVLSETNIFNVGIPVYLGSSAAFMGQFYRAIGVMESGLRRVQLKSLHDVSRFYRAHIGNILLMAGKEDEAKSHLDAAQKDALAHNDAWTLVWSQRALAYSYFLEGRIEESYKLLRESLAKASHLGIIRPVYGLPWVLELLFEYHKNGYDPIPEYDFERELKTALNGINIHLQGTALRIQAKLELLKETELSKIEKLLLKSEEVLKTAPNPIQLGKTRADLAQLKLRKGDRKKATELSLMAWQDLSGSKQQIFPNELKPLIEKQDSISQIYKNNSTILKRYMEMIDELIPSDDPKELLFRLISATSRFFEAERGAVFWFENKQNFNQHILRTSYNLTQKEVDSEEFRTNLKWVFQAYKKNKAVIQYHPESNHAGQYGKGMNILCLPIEIEGEVRGVLYHDSTFNNEVLNSLDKSIIIQLSKNIGNYIVRVWEYCRMMEKKSLLALRQTTYNEEYDDLSFIAQSRIMRDLLARVDKAAESEAPVLILGETGVGKGLLARRFYLKSERRMMPFITVNLSSLPESLIESELFGHEKGAFTGADRQKPGRIELAHKGTLFIDEVGDIPIAIQPKILKVLEEKSYYRIGGTRNLTSDFRLVAATNRNLLKEVAAGNFREDLYYRLNVIPIIIPPLRKRGNDIILLAKHFLNKLSKKYNQIVPDFSFDDRDKLKAYHWPGNVRELQSVIERSIILSDGSNLDLMIPDVPQNGVGKANPIDNPFQDHPTMDELQKRYINYLLMKNGSKISGPGSLAEILAMKRTTLTSRMKKLGISSSKSINNRSY